jgi:hypothetical protein
MGTESKHTRGQIKVIESKSQSDTDCYDLCVEDEHGFLYIGEAMNSADAVLWSAAPELLEALRELVHGDDPICKCHLCKIGKAAIRKATEGIK